MNTTLPPLRADADPAFTDAKSCAEWLRALPMTNVASAHGKLLGELEELNACELPPAERIRILELVREPALFLQSEQSRRYVGKAVPLGPQERPVFVQVIAMWTALAQGWGHCFADLARGHGSVSGQAALICQRAMWTTGQKIAENGRIFQEFNAAEWRSLNEIFAFAETAGALNQAVANPLPGSTSEANCLDTFLHIQLLALANPNEHAPRQQELIAQWARHWARKAKLGVHPPAGAKGTPLCVDLGSDAQASRSPRSGERVRYLNTDDIGKSLRRRIAALKQGESPESLGLGNSVTEGLAAQMMVMLHQQWCEDKTARQAPRRPTVGHAQVSGGLPAIHYFITGHGFDAQGDVAALTARQREHIETFGQLSTRGKRDDTHSLGYSREQWRVLGESLVGIRLERPRDAGHSRFLHRQLVAIRPADAKVFTLGSVRWISVSENALLRIGVRTMPGTPEGVSVRLGGINAPTDKFVQAVLLSAMPALHAPATLIVPAGWFRPKRLVELRRGSDSAVLLTAALERGSNFDRCTFEPA